jgi:hypothetical protein
MPKLMLPSVIPGRDRLVLGFSDDALQRYRVRDGKLEFQTAIDSDWHALTPDEILQHLMLQTPVANWLRARIGWRVKLPSVD